MPITDNVFTEDEFKAAVDANPNLRAVALASVRHLGVTPYTAAELETELGKQLGSKISEVHTAYDRDIQALTGETKQGAEKSYDYLKRAVGVALTARQAKIAELEKSIAEGSTDPTLKAKLADLEKKEAQWLEKEAGYTKTSFEKDVLLDLRLGAVGIKLSESVPESVRKLVLQNAEQKVLGMAKVQTVGDKSSIVYMENGEVVLNEKREAADAGWLIRRELKDVLAEEGPQGGGGGGGKGGNPPKPVGGLDEKGNVILPDALPAEVKNQGQLIDYLVKLGVPKDTPQFDKAFGKFSEKLPLF